MTPSDLKKLIEASTPGPWTWDYAKPGWLLGGKPVPVDGGRNIPCVLDGIADDDDCNVTASAADRALIATLRNNADLLVELWEAVVAYKENLIGDFNRDGVFIHQFYTAAPAEYGEAIDDVLAKLQGEKGEAE